MQLLSPLTIAPFRHLFAAQALSLLGSGLATVALGLLAYQLAPDGAGAVLGTALAIKMLAYVFISPLAAAAAATIDRTRFLVGLDLVRAVLVLLFPFVTEIWQVYALIFAMFSLTAGFSPVFQATIPEVVKEDDTYINALSLSRLAFNTETILSPIIAGLLLGVITFNGLFLFTSVGFIASALLIRSAGLKLPSCARSDTGFIERAMTGMHIFRKTPRLKGLLALNLVIAMMGANVYVNSIVIGHDILGGGQQTYLNLLLISGVGAVIGALILPTILQHSNTRIVCLFSAVLVSLSPAIIYITDTPTAFYGVWFAIGFFMSLILTSSGVVIRSSAQSVDMPSVFAAQFSLSHACWFFGYLFVGWLGAKAGPLTTLYTCTAISLCVAVLGWRLWKPVGQKSLHHAHPAHDHTHMHVHDAHHQHSHVGDEGAEPHSHPHHHVSHRHTHRFVIDAHHNQWP